MDVMFAAVSSYSRGLGRKRSGSMKPLELARDRLVVKFSVRQCSGLSFRRCVQWMRDFFPCSRCSDVSYALCVVVIRTLLGEDRQPRIVCSRFSAVGAVVSDGCAFFVLLPPFLFSAEWHSLVGVFVLFRVFPCYSLGLRCGFFCVCV